MSRLSSGLLTFLSAVTPSVLAQCPPAWLPGDGRAGTDGDVFTVIEWDPDGAGPLGPRIVVGGQFAAASTVFGNGIAAFDPATATWSSFGSGIALGGSAPVVNALAVLPNGDLVAGGQFTSAGGVAASNVARWNGSSWSP